MSEYPDYYELQAYKSYNEDALIARLTGCSGIAVGSALYNKYLSDIKARTARWNAIKKMTPPVFPNIKGYRNLGNGGYRTVQGGNLVVFTLEQAERMVNKEELPNRRAGFRPGIFDIYNYVKNLNFIADAVVKNIILEYLC